MVVNNKFINNIGRIPGQIPTNTNNSPQKNEVGKVDFKSVLNNAVEKGNEVKFSKHAEMRLQTRNINLSQQQKEKLEQAVNKADAKGVRDSLVVLDNLAFVVNVKSRTVVTAVQSSEMKENVFTNIDGAVFG